MLQDENSRVADFEIDGDRYRLYIPGARTAKTCLIRLFRILGGPLSDALRVRPEERKAKAQRLRRFLATPLGGKQAPELTPEQEEEAAQVSAEFSLELRTVLADLLAGAALSLDDQGERDLDFVLETFIDLSRLHGMERGQPSEVPLKQVFDVHFQGRQEAMWRWLVECGRRSFGPFSMPLRGAAPELVAALDTLPFVSPPPSPASGSSSGSSSPPATT